DGTTDAEILVGDVATLYDDVTVVGAGQFASAEAGEWDVAVTYTVTGDKAGNYIAPAPETLRGVIVYVEPKSLVVTTLDDVVDRQDGVTSIREAISYAESLGEPVAVTFADGLEGTITLAEGALSVGADSRVTVDGGGAIAIDAGGESRVFEIGAAGAELANITLENGAAAKQGGAIASTGDLTLTNVTVSDSTSGKFGGAVYAAAGTHLTVIDSTFTDNAAQTHGGAIFVEKGASAEISGSYFSGNSSAAYGGAIYTWTDSTVDISNSIFVKNKAPNGTIRNHGGELNLINVVLSGNEQGLATASGGTTTATNVTISKNRRSAVRGETDSASVFYNSIVLDGGSVLALSGGATVAGDNNLSSVRFGLNTVLYDGGDLFAADGYSLTGENQAMNAGKSVYNDTEFDAAGRNRYYGGAIDIGAVEQIIEVYGTTVEYNGEYQAPVGFYGPAVWAKYSLDGETWSDAPVTRNAGTHTFWVLAGTASGDEELYRVTGEITPLQLTADGTAVLSREYDGTTRADVVVGEVVPLYDDVTITATAEFPSAEPGVYDVEVTYAVSGELAGNYIAPVSETIRAEITPEIVYSLVVTTLDDIVDPYDDVNSIREAVAYAETFDVPVTVTFAEGLEGVITLADGAVTFDSGAHITIDGDGRITIDADGADRAFYINSGAATLANISIENGSAAKYGGAVYNGGELTLENVAISGSYSGKYGGAVYTAKESSLTVIDSTFTDNESRSHGGAIFVEKGATAEISGSSFTGNSNLSYGAAIYIWNDADVKVSNTMFVGNTAPNGTIRNYGGNLEMINTVIAGNDQGISSSADGTNLATNVTVTGNYRSAVRGENGAVFTFYNSILMNENDPEIEEQVGPIDMRTGATIDGDFNLSTVEFGSNFIMYDGGDLFAEDGYTLWGNNQAMSAGSSAYNDTEYDAAGNHRYYGGELDLGGVEQTVYAYGTTVEYNGDYQAPVGFYGPATWAKYSLDGETWSDTPLTRDAGTYTFYVMVGTDIAGEEEVYQVTGTVTPKAITVSGTTVGGKVYDGTADATVTVGEVGGLVDGDDVVLGATGLYDSPNAGEREITVSYTLSGADAGNYYIPESEVFAGEITPKQLTVSGTTVDDKYYDGTTDATVNLGRVAGIVPGDQITVDAAGQFSSPEVGEHDVTVTYTVSGDGAGNYIAPAGETLTAVIKGEVVDWVTFDGAEYVYNATARSISVSGAREGDVVLYSVDGETYSAALPEFTDAGVYEIYAKVQHEHFLDWTGSATLTITPAALTVNFAAQDKVYDGTADAAIGGYTFTGLFDGDDVTVTVNSASFADKNVGAGKAVTVDFTASGSDAGNYVLSAAAATADITARGLTLRYVASDKVYDATTAAGVAFAEFVGLAAGDRVFVTEVSGAFADAGAGEDKAITVSRTVSGADAGNYTITDEAVSATIQKKQLAVTGTTVANKVYDGTTDAEITLGEVSGILAADAGQVTVTVSGAFASSEVGTWDVPVTYALSGAAASNYVAPMAQTLNASIYEDDIDNLSFAGGELTYDAESHGFTLTGAKAGDVVRYSTDGVTFDLTEAPTYTNVGTYKVYVKVSRANYTDWTGSATLKINPKTITVVGTADDKDYDGNVAAVTRAAVSGVIAGDDVTVTVSGRFADKNAGEEKTVDLSYVLTGVQSDNYVLDANATTTADINAIALTVNFAAEGKVYDGTTAATAAPVSFAGLVEGDDVTVTVNSAEFSDKNVGAGKAVTVVYTASGADVDNYVISAADVSADITAKQLSISGTTVADKAYDGTTDATITVGALAGVVDGDAVGVTASGAFPSAEVGVYDVTVSYTLSGADAANYIAPAADTISAKITSLPIPEITFADAEYVYNATARSIEVSGALATDTVLYSVDGETYSAGVPEFTNAGVYTVYAKVSRENYADWTGSATLTITAAEITAVTTAADKVYDGTTVVTLATEVRGIIAGDDVTVTVEGAFADRNVGEEKAVNLVNVLSGAQAGNYTLVANTETTADITPKTVVATVTAEGKVYDGTADAEVALRGLAGKVAGDDLTVTITSASFADAAVGTGKAVTVVYAVSGADAGNYVVADNGPTADITKAALTLTFTAEDKVYDGSTAAKISGYEFTGLAAGETAEAAGYAGAFADKNAGADKAVTVTGYTITGINLDNYELTVADVAADITAKTLTVNFTAENKVYDGTTDAEAAFASFDGLVTGDDVTVTVNSASFADANVGTGKAVTVDFTASGADAGNYVIGGAAATADIAKAALTLTFTADDKVYDGTTAAAISGYEFTGLAAGETAEVTGYAGAFADANAGADKAVTVSGYTISGINLDNYELTVAETKADITKADLTLTFTAVDKVYDGGVAAAISDYEFTGLAAGETAEATGYTGAFADKNVGADKAVTVSGYTITGINLDNYHLTVADVTADITAKELTVNFTAQNKVYDGNTNAEAAFASFEGLVTGDNVTVTVDSASFADKNVGTGKAVTVNFTASGADAGNYAIRAAAVSANITARGLTLRYVASDKVYDATNTASVAFAGFDGLVAGDQVTVSGVSGAFADANAGEDKAITVSRTVSGADAGNYTITDAAVSATIQKKQLAVTGTTVANKVYDGTTDAEITLGTVSGIVAADADKVVVTVSGAFASSEVGTWDVPVTYAVAAGTAGDASSNYIAPVSQTLNASIYEDDIDNLSFAGGSLTYDAESHGFTLTGTKTGDVVRYSTDGAAFDLTEAPTYTNVGEYTVYVKVSRANHADWTGSATLTITPATITVSATAKDKIYDGTTSAQIDEVTASGIFAADASSVTVTAEGQFADKNAGEEKTVNLVYALSGAQSGNYVLSVTDTTTADIAAKTLTATTAAESKVYDGTAAAEATLNNLSGKIAGDDLTVTVASASFADKNVGASKAVTVVYTLSGADAGNYVVDDGDVTADITAKTLTVNFTAQNKVYDGNVSATAAFDSFDGLVSGDAVTVTVNSASFADKNVGADKAVTVDYAASGADLGNYVLAASETTADITAKTLTVNFTAENKVYDGTTDAEAAFASFDGLVTGDDVTVTVNSASFADKNVGTGKAVSVDFTASGADAGNYAIRGAAATAN
ncbi:MAG: hypothetical protein IKE69_02670, partial [Thermoguttaceae bacterium]|nr:hypothetical protein [Thermoguttaceae bacterium]